MGELADRSTATTTAKYEAPAASAPIRMAAIHQAPSCGAAELKITEAVIAAAAAVVNTESIADVHPCHRISSEPPPIRMLNRAGA